jgi:hypothetical protein
VGHHGVGPEGVLAQQLHQLLYDVYVFCVFLFVCVLGGVEGCSRSSSISCCGGVCVVLFLGGGGFECFLEKKKIYIRGDGGVCGHVTSAFRGLVLGFWLKEEPRQSAPARSPLDEDGSHSLNVHAPFNSLPPDSES